MEVPSSSRDSLRRALGVADEGLQNMAHCGIAWDLLEFVFAMQRIVKRCLVSYCSAGSIGRKGPGMLHRGSISRHLERFGGQDPGKRASQDLLDGVEELDEVDAPETGSERRSRIVLAEEGAEADDSEEEREKVSLLEAVRSLAEGRAVRKEAAAVLEETPEWKEYDADVTFKIQLLRARYMGDGEPLTASRRQQLASHIEKAQMETMADHADEAARSLASGMSRKEKEEMLAMFHKVTKRKSASLKDSRHDMAAEVGLSPQELYESLPPSLRESVQDNPEEMPTLEQAFLGVQESILDAMHDGGKLSKQDMETAKRKIQEQRARAEKGQPIWDANPTTNKSTTAKDAILKVMLQAGETLAHAGEIAKKYQKDPEQTLRDAISKHFVSDDDDPSKKQK